MANVRQLSKDKVVAIYDALKDSSFTYAQCRDMYDISMSTARDIALGVYPECPEPIDRKTRKSNGNGVVRARGLRIDPEADALLDAYCKEYTVSRSKMVTNLIMQFHKSKEAK